MPAQSVVETVCGFCHMNCGLEVLVKDGTIDKVRGNQNHPVNRGAVCRKASAAKQMVYGEDRLTHPLAKTPSGGFRRISWDEALDRIADKLAAIRDQDGPQCLTRYSGAPMTEENRDAFVQLLASYGSPNYGNPGHLCSVPRRLGLKLVYGARTDPDYDQTKCILVWGSNPTESMRPAETTAYGRSDRIIQAAHRAGARLIVIDPRRTEIASRADEYLRINPGTDAALGLAMLNVIVDEGLYDRDFVDRWTVGFPELQAHVKDLTPRWAEARTGIGAEQIASLARAYATAKPAVIREGNGLDQHPNVVDTVRITGILTAITGNLDVPGGNVVFPMPSVARCPVSSPGAERLGSAHPLYPTVPFPSVVDSLLTGEPYLPRAMIVYHGNPLLISANETRVRRALKRLDFLVVYDIFMTATAELADIVLPDASDFERYGYQPYSSREGGVVALRQKAIDPVGESRPVFEVEYELAKRLGLGDSYPWASNEEWIDFKLKPLGLTVEDMKRQPIRVVTPPLEYRKYLNKGFDTPSGKVELVAAGLRKHGYEPLPAYREPGAQPSLEFPLIGTTRRPGVFVHTRFRNLPRLRKIEPEPVIRLSPADAGARGIPDGTRVRVRSPEGVVQVKASVSDEVGPGFVVIDFGWGNPGDDGANVNVLTSDEERDPYSAATPNRRFSCQVESL